MEHRLKRQDFSSNLNINLLMKVCFNVILMCFLVGNVEKVEAYKNYTVGDSLGWYDKLAKPTVDYQKWVSSKSFSLGDFLIFNTDSNHTIIQTYNATTYDSCDGQGDDNVHWSSIDPNATIRAMTVAVPLMKEGATYFFSGDYEGEQCINGQKFSVNVTHGQGLPASLKNNPDFASGPTSAADSAPSPGQVDDQAAPDTVISTDFNHPKDVPDDSSSDEDDDTKKSNAAKFLQIRASFLVSLIGGVFVLINLIC